MLKVAASVAVVLAWAAAPALGDTLARVICDGMFDDWSAVPRAYADPAGDHGGAVADIRNVWLANDEDYVYIRLEVGSIARLQETPLHIYFDVDRSAATGWPVHDIGSDFVLRFPEHRGAEQTSSTFDAAELGHADLSLNTAPTVGTLDIEMRVRRDVVFPIRGTEIFAGPDFDVVIGVQNSAGTTQEWAPDDPGGHTHTLATGSLPPYATISLDKGDPAFLRLVTYNVLRDGLVDRPAVFDRILGALQPDIICFQELWDSSAATIRSRLDGALPLGDDARWEVYKNSGTVLAARWQLYMRAGDTIPSTQRGQAMAVVDLPDTEYDTDLYVICAHYKCCGGMGTSEDQRRQTQSDANVNWFRDLREPAGHVTLSPNTPILIAGDFNLVGGPQPLETLLGGDIIDEAVFGADSAPDWDGSRLAAPVAFHNAGPAAYTWRSDTSYFAPGRLDYVIYTDSVMYAAKRFVLNTLDMSADDLNAYGLQSEDTAEASDHLPIVIDFHLGQPGPGDADGDGDVDLLDFIAFADCITDPGGGILPGCEWANLNGDTAVDLLDFHEFTLLFGDGDGR
jgi:endonuclease/exonuclease/phosphatase family metal-dependent hydrolase